jgi:hypothetical protein
MIGGLGAYVQQAADKTIAPNQREMSSVMGAFNPNRSSYNGIAMAGVQELAGQTPENPLENTDTAPALEPQIDQNPLSMLTPDMLNQSPLYQLMMQGNRLPNRWLA